MVVGHEAQSPEVLSALSAAASSGGESSLSSPAESNFRELDDVFLQTQTRIWLGEVLQTRLEEQLHIADLLADGELLFQVSREVWKMMSAKHMELRSVKAYKCEPFASRRRSGRYLPYSNVDSFLKICKILGLAGIDLFSPSDVVEKRDARKVCMCIRSFSKKARSRHLNVPDFDIVTYTVAMPTDMVGYIRRSWESSHYSSSSSASKTPYDEFRQRSRQSNGTSGGNYDLFSEESGEAESNFLFQSGGSFTSCLYDTTPQMNSDIMNYPEESFALVDYPFGPCPVQLEDQNQQNYEYGKGQWQEDSLNESIRSFCSQNLEYDHQLDGVQSPSLADSNSYLGSRASHTEYGARRGCEISGMDLVHFDLGMEDGALVVGDYGDGSALSRNHIDDVEVVSIASMSSVSGILQNLNFENHLDSEDDPKTIQFRESPNSIVAISIKKFTEESKSQNKVMYDKPMHSHSDNFEVSSIASIRSASSVVQNLNFENHLDGEDDSKTIQFPESPNNKVAFFVKESAEESKSQDKVIFGTPRNRLATDNEEVSPFGMTFMNIGFSSKLFIPYSNTEYDTGYHRFLHNEVTCMSQMNANVAYDEDRGLFDDQCSLLNEFHQWDQKGKCKIAVVSTENAGLSLTKVDLHKEGPHSVRTKATGGAIWHKNTNIKHIVGHTDTNGNDATMAESDLATGKQQNKRFETACFDNTKDETYEESDASRNIVEMVESEKSHTNGGRDVGIGVHHLCDPLVSCCPGEPTSDEHCCATTDNLENAGENSDRVPTDQKKDIISTETKDQDNRIGGNVQQLAVENSDVTEDPSVGKAERKAPRRPLLKTVARGTAVVGVLILVLRLRKHGKERTGEFGKQSNPIRKTNGINFSSAKGQKESRVNGVYPADKLKFGN